MYVLQMFAVRLVFRAAVDSRGGLGRRKGAPEM